MSKNISPRKSANTIKSHPKPHENQHPKNFALNILPEPIRKYVESSRIFASMNFTNQRSLILENIPSQQNQQTKYHKPETPPLNPTDLTDIESYQTKKTIKNTSPKQQTCQMITTPLIPRVVSNTNQHTMCCTH